MPRRALSLVEVLIALVLIALLIALLIAILLPAIGGPGGRVSSVNPTVAGEMLTAPNARVLRALQTGIDVEIPGVRSANPTGALDTVAEGQRIVPYYPPNRGFMGTPVGEALQPGTLIDRFGSGGGRFVSPAGTPIPARALPPGVADGPYNVFRVVKPFDVRTGPVSPWFGQPGLGIQHELPVSVTDLLRNGYIERVGP